MDAAQDLAAVCESISKDFLALFFSLLRKFKGGRSPEINPLVTYVVSDGFMRFTIDAAVRFRIPILLFSIIPVCAFIGIYQCLILIENSIIY